VGGYVGYMYAPEKVVEVSSMTTSPMQSKNGMIVESQHNLEGNVDVASNTATTYVLNSEEMACSEVLEIEDILSTFDTNSEQFWRRLIFDGKNTVCTKITFENGNALYSLSAGCGFCFKQIYKDESGYQNLHFFSKLFNNLIITVNDRDVEMLNVITGESRILVELSDEEISKTYYAGEVGSSKFNYNDVTNTITVSVFDKNTCEIGHGGCYYSEIESDVQIINL